MGEIPICQYKSKHRRYLYLANRPRYYCKGWSMLYPANKKYIHLRTDRLAMFNYEIAFNRT